ncbi:MAG: anti-sigma factor [Chloroflexi bacterium]|nr:anti-sigma factor [Chloroflexota bacterium]
MINRHPYTEWISAFVLDALSGDERAQMEKHLATCETCPRQLDDYRVVTDLLPFAAPLLNPPARLRRRVLAATVGNPKPRFDLGALLSQFLRAPAFAALALVIAALAVWQAFSLQNQLTQQATTLARQRDFLIALAYADGQPLPVKGTDAAPQATGRLYRHADESSLTVFVQDMPALAANQVYQLWLIDTGGDRTSGGTFTVDAQGRGWLIARAPRALNEYKGVGVTIEPSGGSPKPTGTKVLGGEF